MKNLMGLLALVFCTGSALQAQSDEVYSFDHEVKMQMTQYKKDKAQGSYDYSFLFPDDGKAIGIIGNFEHEGERMKTKAVFDVEEKEMLTLLNRGGMKMGMKMNTQGASMDEEDTNPGNIKKTGRTKEILGYNAEEYEMISEDDDSYSLVWISDDVNLPNFYEAFTSLNREQQGMAGGMPRGFMLEMTTWPEGEGGKEKFTMEVTEINKDKDSEISAKGYRIMEMPGYQR